MDNKKKGKNGEKHEKAVLVKTTKEGWRAYPSLLVRAKERR